MVFEAGDAMLGSRSVPSGMVCKKEKSTSAATGRIMDQPSVIQAWLKYPSIAQKTARVKTAHMKNAFHQTSAVPYGIAVKAISTSRERKTRVPVTRAILSLGDSKSSRTVPSWLLTDINW